MSASTALPRAGRLDCVCEPGSLDQQTFDARGVALLAIGFAFSVLSQVLTLSVLPLAGLSLAPAREWATLPYATFYIGAAIASLPASLLLDSFGRRAAFSLGASLGAAGGLVLVWALMSMHFGALLLGSFWLGIAGGFSLFYRHAAVPIGGKGNRALFVVFGGATLASLVAPTIASFAETIANPRVFVGMAAAAALAHVASLLATAALPFFPPRHSNSAAQGLAGWRVILLPTAIGALGWFAMTALMGATPIAVLGCAPLEAVSGAVAWHVMAMYAPSLVVALAPQVARAVPLALGGLGLLAVSAAAFILSDSVGELSASAAAVGIGWSLVTLGTTLWVHRAGNVSRWLLGLHDSTLLVGAILGAVAAGLVA